VFFDPPPGYPWPKHPCTDSSRLKIGIDTCSLSRPRLLDPEWDWFIFSHSAPVRDFDWEKVDFVGDRMEVGRKVVGTELIGNMVVFRRKQTIKVIKRNSKSALKANSEYDMSTNITTLIN
jgi:hypothetical protein